MFKKAITLIIFIALIITVAAMSVACNAIQDIIGKGDEEDIIYTRREKGDSYVVEAMILSTCTLSEVVIPETYNGYPVTSVTGGDWEGERPAIKKVVLPNTLTTIDDYAFGGFTSLTSIIVPENVTWIGAQAFYNCKSLQEVQFNAITCVVDSMGDMFEKSGNNRWRHRN